MQKLLIRATKLLCIGNIGFWDLVTRAFQKWKKKLDKYFARPATRTLPSALVKVIRIRPCKIPLNLGDTPNPGQPQRLEIRPTERNILHWMSCLNPRQQRSILIQYIHPVREPRSCDKISISRHLESIRTSFQ